MKNIIVFTPVDEKHRKLLEEKAPGASFVYANPDTVDPAQVRQANIIIGSPPLALLKQAENLEWLQLQSAGVDDYGRPGVLPPDCVLTNASGAFGPVISEYMLAVLLQFFRRLHNYRDNQREAKWAFEGVVRTVRGSTILIIGAGNIGGEFAKRVKALGAYTLGIRRVCLDRPEYLDELYSMSHLHELLPRADAIAMSLPLTRETYKVINRETINLMKRDAVLINVGRGSSIDTEDLCDALENGRIAGAALDVVDPEPLPQEHRMWRMKNAIITPHVAGGYGLAENVDRIIGICAANLEAFMAGEKMPTTVDLAAGY